MQKEKLKPEQVVAMLRKQGREVSIEQATVILDFLRKMAKCVVEKYISTQRQNNLIKKGRVNNVYNPFEDEH